MSLLARWRGEQTVPHVTYSVSPLVSVDSWDGFFYPTRPPIRLSIHHFRSLPVIHSYVCPHDLLLQHCHSIRGQTERRGAHHQGSRECGYRNWTIREIREKQQSQRRKTDNKNKEKSRCIVTLPYVQEVTKPVQRILKHHGIASAVRPHRNLRQILLQPKDIVEDKAKPIVCTTSNVRPALCVTSVKQEEHLA